MEQALTGAGTVDDGPGASDGLPLCEVAKERPEAPHIKAIATTISCMPQLDGQSPLFTVSKIWTSSEAKDTQLLM